MSKKLKWIIISLVALVVLLIVLSKMGVFGKDQGTKVTAEKAVNRTITETVNASGKIYPEVEVKISSDISGEIVELDVAEGDTVKKGQILCRVYADVYTAARDQAAAGVAQSEAQADNSTAQLDALKATLDQTQAAYNREKTLVDQKVVSQSEFEQSQQAYFAAKANYAAAQQNIKASQAGVQSAEANLNSADKTLGKATITAPMDGVVSLLEVKKGERVVGTAQMTGTEIMRIADLSSIEAQVDVGENDIPKVKIGDSASVQVDAYNNRKFKGLVYKIANPTTTSTTSSTTSTTVTNYEVHIRLFPSSYMDLVVPHRSFPFRPDMSTSADIQTQTVANALSVPLNAVTVRDNKNGKSIDNSSVNNLNADQSSSNQSSTSGASDDMQEVVFVLRKDNTVKKFPVKTGIQDLNNIQIISGLKDSDMVITGPYDVVSKQLADSMKVQVVSKDQLLQDFKKQ
jgi:HlyD family secretion protein